MKKILVSLVLGVLSAALVSQAQAGPKNVVGNVKVSSNNIKKVNVTPINKVTPNKINKLDPVKFKDYHVKFGVKFDKGVFYKGKNHQHWTLIRFDIRYGCNVYWDPCVLVWYYWCEQDVCYYPVNYCPYRTYCNCDVAAAVEQVSGANIRPDGVTTSSDEPPMNDIPPVPEPIEPRR